MSEIVPSIFPEDAEGTMLLRCECGNHDTLGESHCGLCGDRHDLYGEATYQVYVDKNFSTAHETIISQANNFLDEYQRDGYSVSLRQLYYQFVANVEGFPNTEQSYKRLGGIITSARLAGRISFKSIEDRGRSCKTFNYDDDPSAALEGIEYSYSELMWAEQDTYVEVWVEKDALSGVIERPCQRLQVPYMACKGYMSASAAHVAGLRFKAAFDAGKDCVLIHLGDHDPSGIDMTRDNGNRLSMFAEDYVDVQRIGLNMDQIERYNPPPNPTKITDSRSTEYIKEFGHTCWELDALSPSVISELITDEVHKYIDMDLWTTQRETQRVNRAMLAKIEEHSEAVFDFVRGL